MKFIFCQLLFLTFFFFLSCKAPPTETNLLPAKAVVFCLHDINGKGKYSLSLSEFRQFLDLLQDFPVFSLKTWHEKIKTGRAPKKAVVLTFDDGYPSVIKFVKPFLENYGYGATFYIYVNRYEERSTFYKELSQLNENFEIGSHSLSHEKLYPFDKDKFYLEIYHSRLKLSYLTGKKILSFAWPYGVYEKSFIEIPKLAGYETQVSTESRLAFPQDLLTIVPRFTLYQPEPVKQAKEILKLLE